MFQNLACSIWSNQSKNKLMKDHKSLSSFTHPTAFVCALFSTDMETLLVMGGIPLALTAEVSLSAEVCRVEAEDLIPVADLIADDLIVLLCIPGVFLL